MKRFVVGLVTCGSLEEARKLAQTVLEAKLAACVNIVSAVESHYWWEGKLEQAAECLLLVKTTAEKTDPLMRAIKAAHSYQVPEIIFVPVARGERRYLKWVQTVVGAIVLCCAVRTAGADAVDEAIQQLRDGNAVARSEAAERLAQLGGERAAQKFREMIASRDAEQRQIGVCGLLRVSVDGADLELVGRRLREDPDAQVRWSAALALGQSGEAQAVRWLDDAARWDRSEMVREMAAEAAAKLRGAIPWRADLRAALKEAQSARRPVLVYFAALGATCCRQFEATTLSQPDVVWRAREFVCVRVDVTAEPEPARRYDVRGAPTVLFLGSDGAELGRCAGFVEKEQLLARLAQALRGTDSFREWQRRARQNPADVEANWRVAQLCLDEGREDLAESYLRNVIAYDEENRYGHTPDALLALGVLLGQRGQHAKAVYCYEQVLQRWPAFERADRVLYCLGLSRLAIGRKAEGRLALEQLVRDFSSSSLLPATVEVLRKLGDGQ
ncbi:MAG: divalent cation tolerance protein CutA [Verrucomicrobiae bacterium]|nr:divalent cation tolerance protein CutA [Verrucomicrobiae bacterium]